MTTPPPPSARENATSGTVLGPQRPTNALLDTQSTTDVLAAAQLDSNAASRRRKGHRAGKKKRNRRQTFLASTGDGDREAMNPNRNLQESQSPAPARPPFYRLGQSGGRNLSDASLDSNALLDHRYPYVFCERHKLDHLTDEYTETMHRCANAETVD